MELAPEVSVFGGAWLEVAGAEPLVKGYGPFEEPDGIKNPVPEATDVGAVPEFMLTEAVPKEEAVPDLGGAVPVLLEYGAVPVFFEYGAVPELEYGAVPKVLEYGALPVLLEYGAVPELLGYGAVPVLLEYGAVPVLLGYEAVPDPTP